MSSQVTTFPNIAQNLAAEMSSVDINRHQGSARRSRTWCIRKGVIPHDDCPIRIGTLPAVHSSSVSPARMSTATEGPHGLSSVPPTCADQRTARPRQGWPDADDACCLRECAVAGNVQHPSGRHITICARSVARKLFVRDWHAHRV